jgi:hypothetical protein
MVMMRKSGLEDSELLLLECLPGRNGRCPAYCTYTMWIDLYIYKYIYIHMYIHINIYLYIFLAEYRLILRGVPVHLNIFVIFLHQEKKNMSTDCIHQVNMIWWVTRAHAVLVIKQRITNTTRKKYLPEGRERQKYAKLPCVFFCSMIVKRELNFAKAQKNLIWSFFWHLPRTL